MHRLRRRLEDHSTDPSADPLISVGMALEWLYALHLFRRLKSQQAASNDEETEAGLIWARGKFIHTLADVGRLVTHPGTVATNRPGPKIVLPPVHEFRWASLSGRGGDPGEAEYRRRVAGQALSPPMAAAAGFITGLP